MSLEPVSYPDFDPSVSLSNFSNEVLTSILSYVFCDPKEFSHFVAYASVSKNFLSLCLDIVLRENSRARALYAFNRLPQPEPVEIISVEEGGLLQQHLQLLAIDTAGRHYMRSTETEKGHILVIQNFEKNFSIQTVNLIERLENCETLSEIHRTPRALRIIACHPLANGCVIVTSLGCGMWQLDAKENFKFCFFSDNTEITHSGLYEDLILLCKGDRVFSLPLRDLSTLSAFAILEHGLPLSTEFIGHHHLIQNAYLLNGNILLPGASQVGGVHDETPASYTWPMNGLFKGVLVPNGSAKWKIFLTDSNVHVLNCTARALWIGRNMGLRPPKVFENETWFINHDFLFLGYQGDFKAIYLPKKKDYTEKLRPLISPYLTEDTIIRALSVQYEESTTYISILLQHEEGEERILEAVKVPLELAARETPVSSNVLKLTPSSQRFKKVDEKIMAVSIIIFLGALFTALYLIYMSSSPVGPIVYQDSSLTLTLPSAVLLAISGMSLLSLAVASYLRWKRNRLYSRTS